MLTSPTGSGAARHNTTGASRANLTQLADMVAEAYEVDLADVLGPSKLTQFVRPRFVAIAVIRQMTKASLPRIGQFFGQRDHTSILHALQRVEADAWLSAEVARMAQRAEAMNTTRFYRHGAFAFRSVRGKSDG